MTTVTISSKDGLITGFSCKGHADYAEEGSDIVCAAVSVLTTTCVNALESIAGIVPKVKVRDGLLEARISDTENHDAQIIFRYMLRGLSDTAEEYPSHVRLICSEEINQYFNGGN